MDRASYLRSQVIISSSRIPSKPVSKLSGISVDSQLGRTWFAGGAGWCCFPFMSSCRGLQDLSHPPVPVTLHLTPKTHLVSGRQGNRSPTHQWLSVNKLPLPIKKCIFKIYFKSSCYEPQYYVPSPKIHMLQPNTQCDGLRRWDFGRSLCTDGVANVRPHNGIDHSSALKEQRLSRLSSQEGHVVVAQWVRMWGTARGLV